MAKPEPRQFEVTNSTRLTPNMHRISLGGEGLNGFPANQAGGYVKFMLSKPVIGKPILRTYTIRNQTEIGLDIDFALHGKGEESGPATKWALDAQMGDKIMVGGPGPAKPLPQGHGPFLLVGDMTALPAISVNLESLPHEATGQAFVLIRDAADKQDLVNPEGVTVHWLVEKDLGADPGILAAAVRQLPRIEDYIYIWVACEFEAMKLLRQYLRAEQQFGKEELYISSYWKRGVIEDDHKKLKRADAVALG